MFILECARQAETYIVHKYECQSVDTKFILTGWSCEFSRNFTPTVSLQSKSIFLRITTNNTLRVKDRLLSQIYRVKVSLDNIHMATVYMSVKYMSDEAYHKVRAKVNNSIINQKTYFSDQTMNVFPEYVYRRNSNNVVVRSPEFEGEKVTSLLTVNMSNTAYFDHAQDHYPAMVLMEAGKQNCQLWISKFKSIKIPVLIEMQSSFSRYAEFDNDVQIISEKISSMQENKVIFNVLLKQKGVNIANMVYSFKMFDI
ncbi:TPA: hypothetical protein I8Y21_006047 [Klebsiella oxytoca]|uniref:A-factor biosynthesis hotdog domain-containing protein n=1 Tax=Klebsiella oxytoca TaxID=571 RepID=A0AAN5LDY1_KLEOX|nr:hypothetical protein [Klebsiella oxytoca]